MKMVQKTRKPVYTDQQVEAWMQNLYKSTGICPYVQTTHALCFRICRRISHRSVISVSYIFCSAAGGWSQH